MAWCLQKTEDDKIYLKLNKKKAIDPSTGSEFGPLVKAEGGRSSDELWVSFGFILQNVNPLYSEMSYDMRL